MKERPNSGATTTGSPRIAAEPGEAEFEANLRQSGFAAPARKSSAERIFGLLRALIPFGRYRAESVPQHRVVAFDGFRSDLFEDKRERDRRYGTVYSVLESETAYLVRLELPRRMPNSSLKEVWHISDEMPDYACRLTLSDNVLCITAGLPDEARRRLSYVSSSFPADFETRISFQTTVVNYNYRIQNKVLEIIVNKEPALDGRQIGRSSKA